MDRTGPPWHRPRNVYLALLAGLYLWLATIVLWALNAEANPMVDTAAALEALAARGQPEGENGWPHLLAAGEIVRGWEASLPEAPPRLFRRDPDRFDDMRPELDFLVVYDEDPEPEAVETVLKTVAAFERLGAFDRFAEAASCPRLVIPYRDGDLHHDEVQLTPIYKLVEARWLTVYAAAARGDGDGAAEALAETLAIADGLSHNGSGWSLGVLRLDRFTDWLASLGWSAEALSGVLGSVLEYRPAPIEQEFEADRLRVRDLLQRFYTDNGRGSGWPVFSDWFTADGNRLKNLGAFAFASRRQVMAKADEYFDAEVRYLRQRREQRQAAPVDADAVRRSISWRYLPLCVYIRLNASIADSAKLSRTAFVVAAALELHERRHGDYPETLEDLVPAILAELPDDPFRRGPLGYRIVTADPHGRGYLLWSAGDNGLDDGGDGDDRVVNRARPPSAALREALAGMVARDH